MYNAGIINEMVETTSFQLCVLSVHRVAEGAEVVHVRAEDEVAELRERKEDREEHDGKAEQVHRCTVDGRRQSTQRPREIHVFE